MVFLSPCLGSGFGEIGRMPLVTRLSGEGGILADSNRIETVEEDEVLETIPRSPPARDGGSGDRCGGGEGREGNNDANGTAISGGGGDSGNVVGGGGHHHKALMLLQERRRLVDRTVSEGQLRIVPVGLRVRSKSTDDEGDRPDFFELRAKGESKNSKVDRL